MGALHWSLRPRAVSQALTSCSSHLRAPGDTRGVEEELHCSPRQKHGPFLSYLQPAVPTPVRHSARDSANVPGISSHNSFLGLVLVGWGERE